MGVRPRPTEDEYLQLIKDGKLIIKDPDGQEVDLTADGLMIDIVDAKEYETNSNLVASTDDADKMHQIIVSEDYDTYMIVISGLEKPGEYTVVSDEVTGYTYEVVEGDKSIIYNKENAEFEKIWEGEEGDEVTITVSWMPDYDKIIESLHKAITVKGTYP